MKTRKLVLQDGTHSFHFQAGTPTHATASNGRAVGRAGPQLEGADREAAIGRIRALDPVVVRFFAELDRLDG